MAINTTTFEAALKVGIADAMRLLPGMIPMLHISAHGHQDGIQLSSGEVIVWAQLRGLLHPLNTALNNGLLVCLSSCEGYSGTRMAMFPQDEGYPFYAIVANSSKPSWSDTAVAYSTFYHLVGKGEYIRNAVEAMKVASGNDTFWIETAQESRQNYIDFANNINAQTVQAKLEENVSREPPGRLEEMRKLSGVDKKP